MLAASRVQTARPVASGRRAPLSVRASLGGSNGASVFADGQKVKVSKPVKVFHVPKHPEGVELEGMVGEVQKNCTQFKGKVLSANFPYVVKFITKMNGADVKFSVHLVGGADGADQEDKARELMRVQSFALLLKAAYCICGPDDGLGHPAATSPAS